MLAFDGETLNEAIAEVSRKLAGGSKWLTPPLEKCASGVMSPQILKRSSTSCHPASISRLATLAPATS